MLPFLLIDLMSVNILLHLNRFILKIHQNIHSLECVYHLRSFFMLTYATVFVTIALACP